MVERQEADWEVDIGHMMSTAIGLQRIVKELEEKRDEEAGLVIWRGGGDGFADVIVVRCRVGAKGITSNGGEWSAEKES